jgi:hypothetical protein
VVTTVVTCLGRDDPGEGPLSTGATAPSPAAPIYQNLIVRTRTPLAQLLPVLATALVRRLSTLIITFTCDMYSGIRAARRELFAFAVWMR